MSMQKHRQTLISALLYLCCVLLVTIFVHLFSLFTLLKDLFGSNFINWSPIILPILFLIFLLTKTTGRNRQRDNKVNWLVVISGIIFASFALFIPDPNFAVKRIHVFEYLLLSLLARYTMSYKLQGKDLFVFSSLFSVLLGLHDEFLQGLHPARTYGLRDMAVNGCSSIAGNMIWHGLRLYNSHSYSSHQTRTISPLISVYLLWLVISVLLLAVPVSGYLHSNIPFWTTLPLLASLAIGVIYRSSVDTIPIYHGLQVVSYTAFLFLTYPLVTNILKITFY